MDTNTITNSASTPSSPGLPTLNGLTRDQLVQLYREIRQALILTLDPVVTDNANVMAVRSTLGEKRCIEMLATLHRHSVSAELRKAIRTHLKHHQNSIATLGGFADAIDDHETTDRTRCLQDDPRCDSGDSIDADPHGQCA